MAAPPADATELDQLVSPASAQKMRNQLSTTTQDILDDCWVLEENWTAARLFWACASSCWQHLPMTGMVQGLNYPAVDVVIRRGGFEPITPDDWRRFQVLEAEARQRLNQSKSQR